MGLFEDFSNFLKTRLEEFLKDNPHAKANLTKGNSPISAFTKNGMAA